VVFTTNIPIPVVTLGNVSDTTVELSWASDQYATWHRVEYTTGSARAITVVGAQLSGNGITMKNLTSGTTYNFRVYSGMGASYYEPHGTLVSVTTAASNGESQAGLGSGKSLLFLCSFGLVLIFLEKVLLPALSSAFWVCF